MSLYHQKSNPINSVLTHVGKQDKTKTTKRHLYWLERSWLKWWFIATLLPTRFWLVSTDLWRSGVTNWLWVVVLRLSEGHHCWQSLKIYSYVQSLGPPRQLIDPLRLGGRESLSQVQVHFLLWFYTSKHHLNLSEGSPVQTFLPCTLSFSFNFTLLHC